MMRIGIVGTMMMLALGCGGNPPPPATTPATGGGGAEAEATAGAGLVVMVGDQQVPITKDGFTIGGEGADLAIAAQEGCTYTSRVVVKRNAEGRWMIEAADAKGFGFNEMKMDNKTIDDGDEFELCADRLRFSLR